MEMIMAPGAGNGEPHQSSSDQIDSVIDDQLSAVEKNRPYGEKTKCGKISMVGLISDEVRRNLFANKFIVGEILV